MLEAPSKKRGRESKNQMSQPSKVHPFFSGVSCVWHPVVLLLWKIVKLLKMRSNAQPHSSLSVSSCHHPSTTFHLLPLLPNWKAEKFMQKWKFAGKFVCYNFDEFADSHNLFGLSCLAYFISTPSSLTSWHGIQEFRLKVKCVHRSDERERERWRWREKKDGTWLFSCSRLNIFMVILHKFIHTHTRGNVYSLFIVKFIPTLPPSMPPPANLLHRSTSSSSSSPLLHNKRNWRRVDGLPPHFLLGWFIVLPEGN